MPSRDHSQSPTHQSAGRRRVGIAVGSSGPRRHHPERLRAGETLHGSVGQVRGLDSPASRGSGAVSSTRSATRVAASRHRSTRLSVRKSLMTCGAPLRNRTVDLLLTIDHQEVAQLAARHLSRQNTCCRRQPEAPASPSEHCSAPQTAPHGIVPGQGRKAWLGSVEIVFAFLPSPAALQASGPPASPSAE